MSLTTITVIVALLTMVLIAVVGVLYGRMHRVDIEDFLSARDSVTIPLGLATFIAYAAGSGLLFSPPESAVWGGIPAAVGYGFAIAVPYLLYLTVGPKIKQRMPAGHSVVEYAKERYGTAMYVLVLFVALFYMFILMTANFTGVAVSLQAIAGVPLWVTLLIVGIGTMIYTAHSGLLASLFTDLIQTVLLMPLLVISVVVVVVQVGGLGQLYDTIQANAPQLISFSHWPGVRFGIYIVIAVLGAEMLNQSLWQRAHASSDAKSLRISLVGAALAVIPMTILAGLFGVIAEGLQLEFANNSAALPAVVSTALNPFFTMVFVVLILLVITSTLDNALSAMASIFTVDVIPLFAPDLKGDRLLRLARWITVAIAVVGIGYAMTGPSVLFLLLRADLLLAATFVPVLLGLYTPRLSGTGAFLAALLGILGGVPFFVGEQYLYSFLTALVVSVIVCVIAIPIGKTEYDFERLERIGTLE